MEDCKAFMEAFKEAKNVPRATLAPDFSITADLDGHPVCIHGRITSGSATARMNIHPKDNRYMNVFNNLAEKGVDITGATKGVNDRAEFKFVAV